MEKFFKSMIAGLPLIFAFGFLVPLIMQIIELTETTAPFGLSTTVFAIILGGGYGVIAQITGRWI